MSEIYTRTIQNLSHQLERLNQNPAKLDVNIEIITQVYGVILELLDQEHAVIEFFNYSDLVEFLINAIVSCSNSLHSTIFQKLVCLLAQLLFKCLGVKWADTSSIIKDKQTSLSFISKKLAVLDKTIKRENLCFLQEIMSNFNALEHEDRFSISCMVLQSLEKYYFLFYKISTELENLLKDDAFNNDCLFYALVEVLEVLETDFDKEVIVPILVSDNNFLRLFKTLETTKNSEMSDSNIKVIKSIKIILFNSIIKRYPKYIYSINVEDDTEKDKQNLVNFITTLNQKQKLTKSFEYILEILNQGTNQEKLLWNSRIESDILYLYLRELNCESKIRLEAYKCFEQMNSKISLAVAIIYLNFLLSISLCSLFDNISIPKIALEYFKQFQLPPVSKSKSISSVKTEEASTSVHNLQMCIIYCLKLLRSILEEEVKSLAFIDIYTPHSIHDKIVFQLLELAIPSLFVTLIFVERNSEGGPINTICLYLVNELFKTLVNIEVKGLENSLNWVSIINFANDTCYSDLRYAPLFHKLLGYLAYHNKKKIEDPLVQSALQFFYSAFGPGNSSYEAWINGEQDITMFSNEELDFDIFTYDYEYLYQTDSSSRSNNLDHSSSDMSMSQSDKLGMTSTPQKQNYVTNSARQQSIHVDQFGKP